MKEGKIVDRIFVKKNGKMTEVIIRYPKKSDVKEIWKFYNKVIKETEFLSRMTPVSWKDEKKWLGDMLDSVRKGNKVDLLAECNNKIIGSVSIEKKAMQRLSSVGSFGICVLQDFTGIGLGKRMMIDVEKESKRMNIRIIELSVYGKNKIAQNLYKKLGFKIIGKIPKAVKIRNGFDDNIIMYKVLKK